MISLLLSLILSLFNPTPLDRGYESPPVVDEAVGATGEEVAPPGGLLPCLPDSIHAITDPHQSLTEGTPDRAGPQPDEAWDRVRRLLSG